MNKPLTATQQLNRRFLWSLLIISLIVSLTEFLVLTVSDLYQKTGRTFNSLEEIAADTFLLTLISAPLLWFIVMRRLVVTITREQEKVLEQDRQNKELRTALDAHALVSITDKKGLIVYANERFSQVSGYSQDELLGQDHRIVNSGVHSKDFFRELWQTIIQGKTWQGVICNRSKNGQVYWVDSTIMPLLDEQGIPRQYISIRRDITLQKANESRLRTLKRAVDACSEMIIITDAKGSIQYANPALYQFSNWTEESLIGQQVNIFNSPNNNPKTLKILENALTRGGSWTGRLLSRRKGMAPIRIAGQSLPPDPLEFWAEISITPVLNDDGSLFGYVQILRDISTLVAEELQQQLEKDDTAARLEIADTLQRNIPLEERFKATLDILFDLKAFDLQRKGGVFLKSQTEIILEMFVLQGNFSAEFIEKEQRVLYGDCLCGRAAQANELLISDDCFCDPRHEHTFTGMQAHGHFIVPLASGDDVLGIMFLYTDPYPNRNQSRVAMLKQVGELMALAIMREQAQVVLEKARDMAMQASLSKSEFLANMSHEIRTPMNGVLGMLELLNDTELSRTQWDLVETAHNSAESLLEIINDILDFSKLEAGKIEVEKVSFNLGALIEEVSTLLARRAFTKGLELNCFLPANLNAKWVGDPMRIRQVLTNLIGNAIKFTEQGEISVTLKPISSDGNIQLFRFEIRDTGIGIPPNVQVRLFQPFTQAETATARRFGGTGLGLSICKSLVTLMGGTLGLDSAAGKGSCFWFTLPLAVENDKTDEITVDFSGKRVLVVDDNATNRMILNHYLSHWGLDVGQVEDGQAALDELGLAHSSNHPYDLVILDMHMPIMDGLTLAGKLVENPDFANIPRILLSSGALIGEDQRRKLGLTYSLLKPARQSQLFEAISGSLSTNKAKEELHITPEATLPDYHDKKILVAEDNKVNQKVILGLLAKFKIVPIIADNGQIALDILADTSFDLIFMDCQMPVLDGYETTAAIRNREQQSGSARQVIVALTAHAVTGEREKCLAAGMDDYLSKPIRRNQLATILATWLGTATAFVAGELSTDTDIAAKTEKPMPDKVWDEALALKHLDGDKELLTDMIGLFLEEIPGQLAKLHDACNQNDLFELTNVAHAIKGSVGHFCADAVTESAAQLERASRHKESADYQLMTDTLVHGVKILMEALSQSLGNTK
ncbi:response regulator [Methyloglobulus sp.]|uniref:response regulator n=1 Tax=Methyloglobulus sp. TaxID=2518622 RepID=UPI0032B74D4A